jgi:hypothetical protein
MIQKRGTVERKDHYHYLNPCDSFPGQHTGAPHESSLYGKILVNSYATSRCSRTYQLIDNKQMPSVIIPLGESPFDDVMLTLADSEFGDAEL